MSGGAVWKVAKNLLFLLAGVFLLYLAFRGNDPKKLLEDLKHANYFWIALSMFFGVVAFVARGLRWNILLEPMGYQPRKTSSVYSIIVGYLANLAVPRIGEVTRCTVMSKAEDIPVDRLFGTVILERIIDLGILFSLTTFTILLKVDQFGGFFVDLISSKTSSYQNAGLIVFGVLILLMLGLIVMYRLRQRFVLHPWSVKIRSFFLGLKEGLVSIKRIKNRRWFIFHTAMIWLSYYLMTWVAFYAINETAGLGMVDGLFILVVGGFGMAAPVQGGIGAYHLIVSMGMGVLGVSSLSGLSYATIVHTSQTFLVLVTGLISFILISVSPKNTNENKKT
ncbi:MAG: lysylphosphatidylglycerol synthase transmembrane domain-containing protein [Vicingaceae bacterium]